MRRTVCMARMVLQLSLPSTGTVLIGSVVEVLARHMALQSIRRQQRPMVELCVCGLAWVECVKFLRRRRSRQTRDAAPAKSKGRAKDGGK